VRQALLAQYAAHKSWSIQLHRDNLIALAETQPELQPIASYATIRRFCKSNGLEKRRRLTSRQTEGAQRTEARLSDREVRSYEVGYVGQLFHWDGRKGSRKVLTQRGWETPLLIGVDDDCSRLVCHLQWYLGDERAEIVAHGLSQAFQKCGLPGEAMSDEGSAMTATLFGRSWAQDQYRDQTARCRGGLPVKPRHRALPS
jgi:putative transposase